MTQDSRIPGVFFLGLLILAYPSWGKIWTTVEGSRSEGKLMAVEEDRVTLEIQGREYIFPITRFSAPDRAFLTKWKSEPRCTVCQKEVGSERMQAGEQVFHRQCFRCLVCERPFLDQQPIRRDEWGGMVHAEHFRSARTMASKINGQYGFGAQKSS